MSDTAVIFLMYHELESPGRSLCQTEPGYVRYIVRTADFRSQMQWIYSQGCRGVSVGEAVQSFGEGTVAVTFDDGSETDLLIAAPLLRQIGFGATFYVTSGFLGKPGYLNHSQLRELSALGFEIGCHSMSHAYLTDIDDQDLHREVVESKVQLEQILGKGIEHFSCPGGRYDQRVSDVARNAGYRTLATSNIQKNSRSSDLLALGRIPVMRNTSISDFEELCLGRKLWRMSLQVKLRSAARDLLGNSMYDRLRSAVLRHPPSE